jgi:hypothetical protein
LLQPPSVITGLEPVISILWSAAPHRIGMAGSSPAMTGEGVTKAGAGRRRVRDEGGYDPGQGHAPVRDHRSRPAITGPRTLRRHHRARPGDPDPLRRCALHIGMAGTRPAMTAGGGVRPDEGRRRMSRGLPPLRPRHNRACPGDPDRKSAAPHRIGMAGTGPALTWCVVARAGFIPGRVVARGGEVPDAPWCIRDRGTRVADASCGTMR